MAKIISVSDSAYDYIMNRVSKEVKTQGKPISIGDAVDMIIEEHKGVIRK